MADISDHRYVDALGSLSETWDMVCPEEDKGVGYQLFFRAHANGASVHDALRSVVGALSDGLAYGNWPSTVIKF